jgi:putative ABC transport system permease protein
MTRTELSEAIAIAFDALRANPLRSVLATLGITIGVSFVALMGWFLAGLDSSLQHTINMLGEDMLYVDKWDWSGRTSWVEVSNRKPISYRQAQELADAVRTAQYAMPMGQTRAQLSVGSRKAESIPVAGVPHDYGNTPAGAVTRGRFFTEMEGRSGAPVAVLGPVIAKQLFPNEDPVGKEIRIAGQRFTVIGVLRQRGTLLSDFADRLVLIPLERFLRLFGSGQRSFITVLKAGSLERLDDVREEARLLMRKIRRLRPEQPDDFTINETRSLEQSIAVLRQSVWGVGLSMSALSFLVGIIGIVNITFVSVVERTQEIGIRKAVGARRRAIALQFLAESVTLCTAGAVLALLFCTGLVLLVRLLIPAAEFLTPYIPPQHIAVALLVAFTAGILAGWAPALRAARLHPVEALRYE